jgi:hypothetical protein
MKTRTNFEEVMQRRERRRMTEHCLADALGGLLAHSGDEQLQWRGSLTDLMELVGVVARAGLLYNDEGQPLCFAELARLTCRVLHVRLPRNPRNFLLRATRRKGLRSLTLVERCERLLAENGECSMNTLFNINPKKTSKEP